MNRSFTVSIPDNYVDFSKDEINMIKRLVSLKMDFSTDQEKLILNSINDKLYPAECFHERVERAKAGF